MLAVKCIDCQHFGHESASMDCPFPSFWCRMDHWDGVGDVNELYEERDCEDFVLERVD